MTTPTVVPAETTTETTTEIPPVTDGDAGATPAAASPKPVWEPKSKPVVGAKSAPISAAQHAKAWARNWMPPELWTHGRPSLKASWAWAIHGQHLPEHEQVRHASRVATATLIPFRALFLYLDWIFERWSRVIAAAALVLAVIQMF